MTELARQAFAPPPQVDLNRPEDPSDSCLAQYNDLKFNAQRCAYYHGMRARFLDSFGKVISLISFMAGAGAFTTLIQGMTPVVSTLAGVTAFFAGLNLIVGFARKGRDHEVFRSKYYSIMIDIEKSSHDASKLDEIKTRLLGFYADGTIFLSALDAIATKRTCASFGIHDDIGEVPLLHRVFSHIWSFSWYYANSNALYKLTNNCSK